MDDRNPGCYASCLGGCSTKLTLEHYLSDSILKLLDSGDGVRLQGPRFLNGGARVLPRATMGSKVLCKNHNSQLSALDTEALELFRTIAAADQLKDLAGRQSTKNLDGGLIERWLLKVFLGVRASGSGDDHTGARIPTDIPERLVRIVFGKHAHPQGFGLFLDMEVGTTVRRPNVGVTFQSWMTEDGGPGYCTLDLNRIHLFYPIRLGVPLRGIHRPAEIKFSSLYSDAHQLLKFRWPSSVSSGMRVLVEVGEPVAGSPML